MSMFIRTHTGRYVNLANVLSFILRDDKKCWVLREADDREHYVSIHDFEPDEIGATIPAAPGWFIIDCTIDAPGEKPPTNLEDRYWTAPILAWRIPLDGIARPLSYETVNVNPAILWPDGHVALAEDRVFDTIADFVEFRQKEASKKEASKP